MLFQYKGFRIGWLLFITAFFSSISFAQNAVVLPGNGKFSSEAAPQGAVRYQRMFYLIDSAEISRSNLRNNTQIQSIGFQMAAPQDSATKGIFRVYLQNTADTVSRVDTGWTEVQVTGNAYNVTGLGKGHFEWQVKANCSGTGGYSPTTSFTIGKDTCVSPSHLFTEAITSTSATLRWIRPFYKIAAYKVEYSRTDITNWQTAYTSDNFYTVTGLTPGKTYQWKVTALCAANSSTVNSSSFTTESVTNCTAPSALTMGTITDTTALVSWTQATGASYYEIRYRRSGTSQWNSTASVSTSATLSNLNKGTSYEWQVRTACTAGTGAYVNGPSFNTTGTTICYAPENLYTDSISNTNAKLSWDLVPGATSYTLRYRQKERISWTNAITPMTPVHNDSIQIPARSGLYTIPFVNGTSFTYTGKGLYVAFEYIDSTGNVSTFNNAAVRAQEKRYRTAEGRDSSYYLQSFGYVSTDLLPAVLPATGIRPETWLGSNSLGDSVEVASIYALGNNAIPYGNPSGISALIRNKTVSQKTYPVTLTIKSATNVVRFTETKNITINKDTVGTVTFTDWSPTILAQDSIIVSVPTQTGENVVTNNRTYYLQSVNNRLLGYADAGDAFSATGLDTAGLILVRHTISGCGAINGVQAYLGKGAVGQPIHAVVTDGSGSVLASSPSYTADSANMESYHSFYFATPVAVTGNTDYYLGIAVDSGYAPLGIQWENGYQRKDAYYTANTDGSNLRELKVSGRPMIRAELIMNMLAPLVSGAADICPGGQVQLKTEGIRRRFASGVTAVSGAATGPMSAEKILGTPDVYPSFGFNANSWTTDHTNNAREYITLQFPAADSINYVELYETNTISGADTIYVQNPANGQFEKVYSGTVTVKDSSSRINRIRFPLTAYKVNVIRIALTDTLINGGVSIDAVAIGRIDSVPSFSAYSWTKTVAGTTSNAGTGATVTDTQAGQYKVTVTANGCTASDSLAVRIKDQAPSIITADRNATICTGDSITLRSSRNSGNVWSNGATTNAITIKASGNFTVSYNNGCGNVASAPFGVTVNPLPTASISGTLGICPGGNTTLTASPSGNYTYAWSNGTTTASNTVSNTGTVTVRVTDNAGCKNTASVRTFTAAVPTPKITGVLNFCPGGSTTLNAGAGFASYTWSGGQTATPTVSVNSRGKYYVRVTNSFGCAGSDTVNVGQFPAPTPAIKGNTSICGGATTLNAGGGYLKYNWSTGDTTQTILARTAGTYSVNIIDINGCAGSASVRTVKDSLPPRPGDIYGATAGVCNAVGTRYFINAIPQATHYVWSVPAGVSITSGQGDTAITVSFGPAFRSGEIRVTAANACGQNGSLLPRVLSLNVKPAMPTMISGSRSGLCASTQVYTIPAVAAATSYQWTVPAGATILNGQGSTSLSVQFSSAFTGGSLCVQAVNACGNSDNNCIELKPLPETPAILSGPTAVCFRQQSVAYTAASVSGASSYTWTVPGQATIVSGQGTNSIRVNFGNQSGAVTVKASNACGSSSVQSIAVGVTNCQNTRMDNTTDPALTVNEKHLLPEIIASQGNTNKVGNMMIEWTLGEPCIETIGSSQRMYTQGFHQPIAVSKPVVTLDRLVIRAAPNPVSTKLNVTFESDKEERINLALIDANGKALWTRDVQLSSRKVEIDMGHLSAGIYFLNITNAANTINEHIKVVKVN